jgi:hypothetical protein
MYKFNLGVSRWFIILFGGKQMVSNLIWGYAGGIEIDLEAHKHQKVENCCVIRLV